MRQSRQRRDKGLKKRRHDISMHREKFSEGTTCSTCGVVFSKGRWVWDYEGETTRKITCPACQRIQGNAPAGIIELRGEFFAANREEILNLVRNLEEQHKENHPLQRLMTIEEQDDNSTLIETTGVQLARRIGDAISSAYQGKYDFQYADNDNLIRVEWER